VFLLKHYECGDNFSSQVTSVFFSPLGCALTHKKIRASLKLRGKIVTTEPKESGRGEKNSFDQESWKTTVSKRHVRFSFIQELLTFQEELNKLA